MMEKKYKNNPFLLDIVGNCSPVALCIFDKFAPDSRPEKHVLVRSTDL